jgi:hypothetical protein
MGMNAVQVLVIKRICIIIRHHRQQLSPLPSSNNNSVGTTTEVGCSVDMRDEEMVSDSDGIVASDRAIETSRTVTFKDFANYIEEVEKTYLKTMNDGNKAKLTKKEEV